METIFNWADQSSWRIGYIQLSFFLECLSLLYINRQNAIAQIVELESAGDLVCIEELFGSDLVIALGRDVQVSCLTPTYTEDESGIIPVDFMMSSGVVRLDQSNESKLT